MRELFHIGENVPLIFCTTTFSLAMFFLRFSFIFIFFRHTRFHKKISISCISLFQFDNCKCSFIRFRNRLSITRNNFLHLFVYVCVYACVLVWVSEFDKWILKTNLTLNNNKRSWNNTCVYCTNWKSKRTKWLFIINRHHLYGWISIQLHVSVSSFKMNWNKISPRRKKKKLRKNLTSM